MTPFQIIVLVMCGATFIVLYLIGRADKAGKLNDKRAILRFCLLPYAFLLLVCAGLDLFLPRWPGETLRGMIYVVVAALMIAAWLVGRRKPA